MVLVGDIWAIAVQQAGLSGYEMSLMRWVEHECYGVALEVEVELGMRARWQVQLVICRARQPHASLYTVKSRATDIVNIQQSSIQNRTPSNV